MQGERRVADTTHVLPERECLDEAKLLSNFKPAAVPIWKLRPDTDQPHVNTNNSNIAKQGHTVLAAE